MSKIQVKFDPTLEQTDIVMKLNDSSVDEMGDEYEKNISGVQQTSVYGIMAPLIAINNIVIGYNDVILFELDSTGVLPTCSMIVNDKYGLISMLDMPGVDNVLRVQILPKFDGKYKKINLTFFITDININNNLIKLAGIYKLPLLYQSQIKSFGEINTYTLFETIAHETKLGFASNIESNDGDKRFVYCPYISYETLMENEIKHSGVETQVLDYWVDLWNNLTLADIYERYNAIDPFSDMVSWVSNQFPKITENFVDTPIEIVSELSNHPSQGMNEFYIVDLKKKNSPGEQLLRGTDKVYSIYHDKDKTYVDNIVQDGDVQYDIFTKYEYLGEVYGEFDYMLANKKRSDFLQKIKTNECVEVTLGAPSLSLLRGNRVNLKYFINDSSTQWQLDKLKEDGKIQDPQSNDILLEEGERNNVGNFILDKAVSGQYLIVGCKYKYIDNQWKFVLNLSRSSKNKINFFV